MRIRDWSSDLCSSDLVRDVPRQTLQPRNARGEVQGDEHRRRARHDGRGCGGILQGGAVDPREDGDARPRGPWLYQGRAAGDDAVGRRGTARQARQGIRSEEHTSELQSLMRISYAVFCLKKKKTIITTK